VLITQTPFRISFAGGGTDLKEFYEHETGKVISTAIDKYVFVIISERFDSKIYINYSEKEIVDSVAEIKHELVHAAMLKTGVSKGVEITMLADIPAGGSGLGSSSSLIVGLLNALYIFRGEQVPAERLANEACEIEIDVCKKPIGKQDQYIAAYGGLREFTFYKDGSVKQEKIDLTSGEYRNFGSSLLLFYTAKTRKSAEILTEQRSNTHLNLEYLKKLKLLVSQVHNALGSRQFHLIGDLLQEGWYLKKKLASKISNPEIDAMYEMALSAGALGGKISGAGGGGFLLLYVPGHKQDNVRNALKNYRELPFLLERDGSKVIFNLRRYPAR